MLNKILTWVAIILLAFTQLRSCGRQSVMHDRFIQIDDAHDRHLKAHDESIDILSRKKR